MWLSRGGGKIKPFFWFYLACRHGFCIWTYRCSSFRIGRNWLTNHCSSQLFYISTHSFLCVDLAINLFLFTQVSKWLLQARECPGIFLLKDKNRENNLQREKVTRPPNCEGLTGYISQLLNDQNVQKATLFISFSFHAFINSLISTANVHKYTCEKYIPKINTE